MSEEERSLKSILLDQIYPKLQSGRTSGFVRLEARDCEALMLILSQSVDIEPLLNCFKTLIGETILMDKPKNIFEPPPMSDLEHQQVINEDGELVINRNVRKL
jgi:hypothetical protein